MVLYIKGYKKGIDDNFVKSFIPNIISIRMRGVCLSKNTQAMDDYLNKMYGLTTMEVVDEVAHNIDTSWYGNNCQIGIDTNAYDGKSNQRLESLMKLIDTGNTDVRGLGIFRESLMYINHYINEAYKLYLRKNEGDGR